METWLIVVILVGIIVVIFGAKYALGIESNDSGFADPRFFAVGGALLSKYLTKKYKKK